jgi:glycosyltransferase involved in cell wall biosynthesis
MLPPDHAAAPSPRQRRPLPVLGDTHGGDAATGLAQAMMRRPTRESRPQNMAVICLSPYQGGMELDALKMADLLSDAGEVTLIARRGSFIERRYREDYQAPGFSLHTIRFRGSYSPSLAFVTRHLLRRLNIGNVLYLGASELKSLYFAFLNLPLTLIVRHGTTKTRRKSGLFHRLIYSRVDHHVAICQHLAANVRHIIPMGRKTQLHTIYPSLRIAPNPSRSQQAQPDGPHIILHVGRIADGKGQREAILACSALHESGIAFRLLLVGPEDAHYRSALDALLDTLPYANCIEFTGFSDDPTTYYAQASVFLFPSKGEGLSNAFIEALAAGLSCVAYDNTSFPELKELGFSLLLAPDQDLPALKTRLLEAVRNRDRDPDHWRTQAELARRLFDKNRERSAYLALMRTHTSDHRSHTHHGHN